MSMPAISKHLKVLQRAGLIERGREAQWRPCRLAAATAQGRVGLARALSTVLGGGFDRLEDYLRELKQESEKKEKKNGRKK